MVLEEKRLGSSERGEGLVQTVLMTERSIADLRKNMAGLKEEAEEGEAAEFVCVVLNGLETRADRRAGT